MKQEVWWVQPLMKVSVAIFYKIQKWQHAPTTLQKLTYWLWVCFWTIKLKFRAHNLFDGLLKGDDKSIKHKAAGVLVATPEGMGHHIL